MPRRTTAALLVGPTRPGDFYGDHLHARHLLTLTVNFHATWTVHPLTADEPGRVSFVADAPEDLLAQGMLAFLAAVLPETLPDSPGLAALLTTDEAGVRRI